MCFYFTLYYGYLGHSETGRAHWWVTGKSIYGWFAASQFEIEKYFRISCQGINCFNFTLVQHVKSTKPLKENDFVKLSTMTKLKKRHLEDVAGLWHTLVQEIGIMN